VTETVATAMNWTLWITGAVFWAVFLASWAVAGIADRVHRARRRAQALEERRPCT
jgi:hypothetical protein